MKVFNMTDIEKFKTLLNAFDIYYKISITKGTPKRTLIVLTENFSNIDHYYDFQPNEDEPEFEDDEDKKVVGYSCFHCYWSFDENGKFLQLGIYE